VNKPEQLARLKPTFSLTLQAKIRLKGLKIQIKLKLFFQGVAQMAL